MKLEGFMIYLAQSKSSLPTEGNFRDNAHKAFDKYKQYISNQDPDVKDVYENFSILYKSMTENLSAFTVRNYTQCFLNALNLDVLKMVIPEEHIKSYSDIVKGFLKEANRTCNLEKKKNKITKQNESAQNEIQPEFENEDIEEPLTLSDVEESVETSSQQSGRSGMHNHKSSQDDSKYELMMYIREQQQQISEDAIRIEFLTKENERLWELVNKCITMK
jgi:hypothetical protein